MASRTEHPTAPSPSATSSQKGRDGLFLRWVFPRYTELALRIDKDAVTIGRSSACELALDDDQVSRQHARITRLGLGPAIEDLGSRNGTFVDGVQRKCAALEAGSVVRVGNHVGVVGGRQVGPFGLQAEGLLGGPELAEALEPGRRAAGSALPILVEGETGTGKEGVARAIHSWSGRSGPFVAVNCGAIPTNLAESELFGHAAGAFSGATESRDGYLRSAHGGTLFLDEVAELPLDVQIKLLRALEVGEVTPLGKTRPTKVDVRIVAAAQRPLSAQVEAGRFREDLLARLDGLTLRLPPLRARREDITPLFQAFVAREAQGRPIDVDPSLIEALCVYDFPRNVRELRRIAQQLVIVHGHEQRLRRSHLPAAVISSSTSSQKEADVSAPAASPFAGKVPSRQALEAALSRALGNVSEAARAMGLSKQKVYRFAEVHGIDVDSFRVDPGRSR